MDWPSVAKLVIDKISNPVLIVSLIFILVSVYILYKIAAGAFNKNYCSTIISSKMDKLIPHLRSEVNRGFSEIRAKIDMIDDKIDRQQTNIDAIIRTSGTTQELVNYTNENSKLLQDLISHIKMNADQQKELQQALPTILRYLNELKNQVLMGFDTNDKEHKRVIDQLNMAVQVLTTLIGKRS